MQCRVAASRAAGSAVARYRRAVLLALVTNGGERRGQRAEEITPATNGRRDRDTCEHPEAVGRRAGRGRAAAAVVARSSVLRRGGALAVIAEVAGSALFARRARLEAVAARGVAEERRARLRDALARRRGGGTGALGRARLALRVAADVAGRRSRRSWCTRCGRCRRARRTDTRRRAPSPARGSCRSRRTSRARSSRRPRNSCCGTAPPSPRAPAHFSRSLPSQLALLQGLAVVPGSHDGRGSTGLPLTATHLPRLPSTLHASH